MNKNYPEILKEIYSGTRVGRRMQRRESIINDYLYKFGEMILLGQLKPTPVMDYIARTYDVSRFGVLKILKEEGVYKGKNNPVVYPKELSNA